MKITLRDLQLISNERVYPINIENKQIDNNMFIRSIKKAEGDITFYTDAVDELRVNYVLEGMMVCPCAITLEDVEVPFEISNDEVVVHKIDADGFYFKETMEDIDLAASIIIPEAPIKVVKNQKIEYSKGDGWSFVSEEDYKSSREDKVDPRLQKLKEYKFEED